MENKKEIDVEIESLKALKNIDKNTDRTAKNLVFFTILTIISLGLACAVVGMKM